MLFALVAAVSFAAPPNPSAHLAGHPNRPGTIVCGLSTVDRTTTESVACLVCHDGTVATSMHVPVTADEGGSHPIEIDYELSRLRHPFGLKPAMVLPQALPLVNGKVSCTTCHDARSQTPSRTSMPMAGSAMCLACHDY